MNEDQARRLVAGRSGGRCELLGRHDVATDYAHRLGRGQRGGWAPSNAVHLCRPCHSWAHANPTLAIAAGLIVPSWADPIAAPVYLDGVLGPGWWHLDDEAGFRWIDSVGLLVPQLPAVVQVPWPRFPVGR
jgi:hypothetical protein